MIPEHWVTLLAAILAPVGSYYGAIAAIRIELAKLESRIANLEKFFDSDHTKLDELRQAFWGAHRE